MTTRPSTVECQICRQVKPLSEVLPAALVRDPICAFIRQQHPGWSAEGYICLADLQRLRVHYVEDVMEREKGELSSLEQEVLENIANHKLLSENINVQFDQQRTFGSRQRDAAEVE